VIDRPAGNYRKLRAASIAKPRSDDASLGIISPYFDLRQAAVARTTLAALDGVARVAL